MSQTTYKVLAQNTDGYWEEIVGEFPASSPKGAIRLAVTQEKASGEYMVAVPTRSFKPMPVSMQTKLELKIG